MSVALVNINAYFLVLKNEGESYKHLIIKPDGGQWTVPGKINFDLLFYQEYQFFFIL